MKKFFWASMIMITLGLALGWLANASTYVDENDILREPFYLIVLGGLLVLLGALSGAIGLILFFWRMWKPI